MRDTNLTTNPVKLTELFVELIENMAGDGGIKQNTKNRLEFVMGAGL